MASLLPPHDPNESPYAEPDWETPLPNPTTVFNCGTPSPADERVAEAILASLGVVSR
jgi:hypothetical protein